MNCQELNLKFIMPIQAKFSSYLFEVLVRFDSDRDKEANKMSTPEHYG